MIAELNARVCDNMADNVVSRYSLSDGNDRGESTIVMYMMQEFLFVQYNLFRERYIHIPVMHVWGGENISV